jgi:hypothetical protein
LEEAGANEAYARLVMLRMVEKQVSVDLGMLCYRFEHRNDTKTHPLERSVMDYIAQWRHNAHGMEQLWVIMDRLREVRDIVEEGRLVGEPES